jgi:hypothetical protein
MRTRKHCDTPGKTNTPQTADDSLKSVSGRAAGHKSQYRIREYRLRRAHSTGKERHRKRPSHRKSDRPVCGDGAGAPRVRHRKAPAASPRYIPESRRRGGPGEETQRVILRLVARRLAQPTAAALPPFGRSTCPLARPRTGRTRAQQHLRAAPQPNPRAGEHHSQFRRARTRLPSRGR